MGDWIAVLVHLFRFCEVGEIGSSVFVLISIKQMGLAVHTRFGFLIYVFIPRRVAVVFGEHTTGSTHEARDHRVRGSNSKH